MLLGQNPGLKWCARRKRSERDKGIIFTNNSLAIRQLLIDDVTKDASFLEFIVLSCTLQFFFDKLRDNGQRYKLGV
jgi:hypothetical protein